MVLEPLRVSKIPVIVHGSLYRDVRNKSLNTIRLHKRIIKEFPDLRNSKCAFHRDELWRSYDDVIDRVKEAKRKNEGIPLLVFLFK